MGHHLLGSETSQENSCISGFPCIFQILQNPVCGQCLLSTLQIWAAMRTRCPHTVSFGFPAQTCHTRCSSSRLPRADQRCACWKRRRWQWLVMWNGCGSSESCPCTQTPGRELQEQLGHKRKGAGAIPTQSPAGSYGKDGSTPPGSLQ